MLLDDPKISNIHSQPGEKLKSHRTDMSWYFFPGPRISLLPCLSAEEGRFDRSSQECGRWKMI